MRKPESTSTDSKTLSRRNLLKMAGGAAAGLTFLQRRSKGAPIPASSFIDRISAERLADRDPALHPPILIDMQTHVWWREGGLQKMTPRGENFLKTLAGSRAAVVGQPVPIADMGRIMFIDDVFLKSETDI